MTVFTRYIGITSIHFVPCIMADVDVYSIVMYGFWSKKKKPIMQCSAIVWLTKHGEIERAPELLSDALCV